MQIQELIWNNQKWIAKGELVEPASVQLILLFGDVAALEDTEHFNYLHSHYPAAHIVGSSTAGTIASGAVCEYPLVATLVALERGWVEVASADDLENETLEQRSRELIEQLPQENLRHVFVLMEGQV